MGKTVAKAKTKVGKTVHKVKDNIKVDKKAAAILQTAITQIVIATTAKTTKKIKTSKF
jgi:hypothetical protein